jgi:diguanylate cyclase (GGDEF)-like protein/PAS domain S-box-containing protein
VLPPLGFYWFMTFRLSSFLKLKHVDLISILESSIGLTNQTVILTTNPNNSANGLKILYVNDAFCRQTGYTQEDIIGLTPAILQGPETCSNTLSQIKDAIKNERPGHWEMVNYTKGKEHYWIELNLTPLSIDGKACDYFIGYSFEMTHHKELRKLAVEKQENLDIVLESMGSGYWDLDLVTNKTNRSVTHDALFGYNKLQKEWTYRIFLSHVVEEDKRRVDRAFTQAMDISGNCDVEYRCEWPDKSIHWLRARVRGIFDEHNQLVRLVGIQSDIDEKKSAQANIYNLAHIDELTQLPNRVAFSEYMKILMLTSTKNTKHNALLIIDLDDFKLVNDTLGHDTGDTLLAKVASLFKEKLPYVNIISRFGGDEFVILIEHLSTDKNTAIQQVEKVVTVIRRMFMKPFYCGENEIYSKVSIGITLFTDVAENQFDLLKQADLALYDAKAQGKSTHRFFNLQLQLDLIRRTNLEKDLRNAIIKNELFLVYQPKVSPDSSVVGVEALLRWRHSTLGIISPAEFIPVAEDTGLIVPIGEWVLKQAISFIEKWPVLGIPTDCTLSINISPIQFKDALFVKRFTSILKKLKPHSNPLILEITENTVIENLVESVAKLNLIKKQGVSFSLDDFGSGFSSLIYLKLLPIDEIKIDKSFIDDIVADERNEVILSAIIGIADKLNLDLVVEGVETIEQITLLNKLEVKVYQGFYFSKPLTERNLIKFITSHCLIPYGNF